MEQEQKNRTRALWSAIVASGTDDLNVMFLAFSLSSIIADLGISSVQAGWIATITNFGMLLGGLIFGILADRYHRFKVFKFTIILFSVATALIFLTPNLTILYLLRFIAGMGVGGEYGVAIAIIASLVPLNKMGRMSSYNGIAGQVGAIASATLAGFLSPYFGWRGLFLFGLAPLALVLWMQFFIDDQALTKALQPKHPIQKEKINIQALFQTPGQTGQTLGLMWMTTVQIAGYFGMMNWLPTMMQELTGVGVKDSSAWMVATILGMCLGMLTFGRLLDQFGPRLTYGTYLIASMLAVYLFFTFAHSPWAMILGGAGMGFFVNGMFAGYGAMISHLYPHAISATANNVILNVGRAVGGFSSVIIGWLLDASSMQVVMLFLAGLYLTSLLVMLSLPALKPKHYHKIAEGN